MDPKFQTSFIPKKPMTAQPGRQSVPINLFSLLATVVFIVALALSGGVYFYKQLVQKQIATNSTNLEKAKGAFDPAIIDQIVRLDTRLVNGKKLLDNHIAVSPFFSFLSSITLKTVRFKSFAFTYLAKDKIQVVMSGQAQSYASVALQSDLLDEQKNLKNTIVSDMALEAAGTVAFNVSTIVDPGVFSYAASIGVIPSSKSAATTTRK